MKVSYVASFEKVMIFNHFDGTFTTYPYVIEVTKLRWKEKENFQDKNSSKIYAKQLINYSMKINVWRKNWECQLLCLQVHEPQKKKYWRWYKLIFFCVCEIAQLQTRNNQLKSFHLFPWNYLSASSYILRHNSENFEFFSSNQTQCSKKSSLFTRKVGT